MINPAASQSTEVHEVHNSNGREGRRTECRKPKPVKPDLKPQAGSVRVLRCSAGSLMIAASSSCSSSSFSSSPFSSSSSLGFFGGWPMPFLLADGRLTPGCAVSVEPVPMASL
jgi:hypothetical protein